MLRRKSSILEKGETIIVECENCKICESKIVNLESLLQNFHRSKYLFEKFMVEVFQ